MAMLNNQRVYINIWYALHPKIVESTPKNDWYTESHWFWMSNTDLFPPNIEWNPNESRMESTGSMRGSILLYLIWLVVSDIFYFSIIYGMSSFPLTFIFFRGVGQPPTRYDSSRVMSFDFFIWFREMSRLLQQNWSKPDDTTRIQLESGCWWKLVFPCFVDKFSHCQGFDPEGDSKLVEFHTFQLFPQDSACYIPNVSSLELAMHPGFSMAPIQSCSVFLPMLPPFVGGFLCKISTKAFSMFYQSPKTTSYIYLVYFNWNFANQLWRTLANFHDSLCFFHFFPFIHYLLRVWLRIKDMVLVGNSLTFSLFTMCILLSLWVVKSCSLDLSPSFPHIFRYVSNIFPDFPYIFPLSFPHTSPSSQSHGEFRAPGAAVRRAGGLAHSGHLDASRFGARLWGGSFSLGISLGCIGITYLVAHPT